ncbi:MAG: Fe-S cluster assembly protein SufD [Gemmatimonadetes bacterium]|nr:Fe-S cluster assembly protein SufD [Gemmatimonadota bacterium]
MTTTTQKENGFRGLHEQFGSSRGAGAPDWVEAFRTQGIANYEEHGLPTLKDEAWRFTPIGKIADRSYQLAAGEGVTREQIAEHAVPGLEGPKLVFVDGRFSPSLSDIGRLPDGMEVLSLAEALRERRDAVEPHLDKLARSKPEALTWLNTAFLEDGIFVRVADNVVAPHPVHALFVTTPGTASFVSPRTLVLVGRAAQVTVIEDYVSLDESATFTNAVTECVVEDGATCIHYVLERENDAAVTVSSVHATQGRDAQFHTHTALVGGGLVRNNVYPQLRGEGGWSFLNGFYVPNGEQHHDTFMIIDHAAPHCDSRQFYRGIMDDRSRAVFSGRIIVHEGAQKTDAKQTNMNLMLSDDALVDTKPQLEIYADDVKCTHGATIGQLDEGAIFYLKSRGVPDEEARGMLTFAFVNEALDKMDVEPVRALLRGLLEKRLPGMKPSEVG